MRDGPSLAKNAGFRRLWSARVVSRFGSALGYVVLVWVVYAETASALAVAYVGLAEFLPTILFGVFSGALVDRYPRRTVVVLSTLGRSAAMAALVLSLLAAGFQLSVVVVAAAVFSVCATFFGPASQALLAELVPKESLDVANGIFESTESVAGIAGSALAGVAVVVIGAVPSLGVDAACYLVGAVLVALVGVSATARTSPRGERHLAREVREGLAWLRGNPGLLRLTSVGLVTNFLFSVVLTFLVVYNSVALRGSAATYGALEAFLAAGWGIGGLVVGRWRLTRYTGALAALTGAVEGGIVLGLVLLPSVGFALPLGLAVGLWQGVLNVTWLSTVQATVPEGLQGRYLATDNALSFAAIPAAQVVGGILIASIGLPSTFRTVAVLSVAATAVFLPMRSLRSLGYDPRRAGSDRVA